MKKLIGVAALAVLTATGCANNNPHPGYLPSEITQYRQPLEQAVASNDTDAIADILANLAQKPFPASDYGMGPLVEKALDAYSHTHYMTLVDNNSPASRNVAEFDMSCQSEIRQLCSQKSREDVSYRAQVNKMQSDNDRLSRQRALQAGNAEISSVQDARYMLNPTMLEFEALQPKASGGDGRYYEFASEITYSNGNVYFAFRQGSYQVLVDPTFHGDVSFNRPVVITGKYDGNQTVQLNYGGVATAARIVDAHVFPIY